MVNFYDSYKRGTVVFEPIKKNKVSIYACGPTVYGTPHIGNLRKFIFDDILRRSLDFMGFETTLVMNITDVGHLTFDQDRLEKAATREHKSAWDIATFYTEKFLEDIELLNIVMPDKLPRATDHINEMIEIIEVLEKKGLVYDTDQAVYFDTSKFSRYEHLAGQKIEEKRIAAREEVVADKQKRGAADFALWFKAAGKFALHEMRWPSPWGEGFPGWHIECSAMSRKYLGQPFDIHTGGVDHIPIHHPNEIAQSEAAFDRPLANYWLHSEYVTINDQKISKSLGNVLLLSELINKNFTPMDFRYLILTSHYRNKLNFTWEGLRAATKAYFNLKSEIEDYDPAARPDSEYLSRFKSCLANDLDTPRALSIMWELVRESNLETGIKRATINEMDKVLGLKLTDLKPDPMPENIKKLSELRDQARKNSDWIQADNLRKDLESKGYEVLDTPNGSRVKQRKTFL